MSNVTERLILSGCLATLLLSIIIYVLLNNALARRLAQIGIRSGDVGGKALLLSLWF